MKILVTGACGFVGVTLLQSWAESGQHELVGIDSLVRPGSEINRAALKRYGVRLYHGDIRCPSDLDDLPRVDVVVEAAANPSVLAGIDGRTSSRQIVEHNLWGTVNVLEFARRCSAAFILLSTSRVYSISRLAGLPMRVGDRTFELNSEEVSNAGISPEGIGEGFSTEAPLSLYGTTKLASEQLALEYGYSYGFPVWINRCGVLAGAGQFGRADQGIFSYWIHSWRHRRPLQYTGFGGEGHQVRDCLHPADLRPLIERQISRSAQNLPKIVNVGGGLRSAMSLRQLSDWCQERLGVHQVSADIATHRFDLPWIVLDNQLAAATWDWRPQRSTVDILEEITRHAEAHPDWLEISDCR